MEKDLLLGEKWLSGVSRGAGGYQFSLCIAHYPNRPVAVGEENQILDKCYTQRGKQKDTKYKITVQTLCAEKYNNKKTPIATEPAYSTMLDKTPCSSYPVVFIPTAILLTF